ncbi:MAG: DotA/TraY family protein [Rhodospirillales bacterium]|nr:DotA/TraY family protein [Rhodospirillales bacterium]
MSGIKTTKVIKYAVMPEVFPRFRALFASGFGYIAYLMAQIYFMVRLLPPHHPYLKSENIGQYGVRHVIAEAANGLVVNRKNLDQLLVFTLMLTGVVLLAVQIVMVLAGLLLNTAMAASIFVTPNPDIDIAYMLLDQVFGVGDGVNNFFNSCVSSAVLCPGETVNPAFPWPFHLSMHNLFRFYSIGILLIGTIIFSYYIVVVIVETATTGSPFGQRFKNLWVPVRLVVAVGLLLPLGLGYNSGQYITFGAAKFGSSMATNGWIRFNQAVAGAMPGGGVAGEAQNLIAMPKPPDAAPIAEALSIVHGCAFAHYLHHPFTLKNTGAPALPKIRVDYPETPALITTYLGNAHRYGIKPYLIKSPTAWQAGIDANESLEVLPGTTYEDALKFYTSGDIVIRFGRKGNVDIDGVGGITDKEREMYKDEPGQVQPTCGEIRIPITDRRPTDAANIHATDGYLGSVAVQRMYFELIRDHWHDVNLNENYIDFAGRMALLKQNPGKGTSADSACNMGCTGGGLFTPNLDLPNNDCGAAPPAPPAADNRDCATENIPADWKQEAINDLQVTLNTDLTQIWVDYNQGTNEFDVDGALLARGWGGAGIWFNKIAQANGAFMNTLFNPPVMNLYPLMMEFVKKDKEKADNDPSGIQAFNPNLGQNKNLLKLSQIESGAKPIAMIEFNVFEYWNKENKNAAQSKKTHTPNAFEKGMNLVFGTHGLFAMTDENANIHPLAQLVALGKGLVEAAVRNVAGASMSAAGGGLSKALSEAAGPMINAVSGMIMSTAFVGLTAGFVLFYVLPFLPFVYFYFAVASWIKTIFEAMVGVPLWALAHLRIDGDGLPGESALNGYFLIFEIFIRPILSVAGLVAAILIFTAQVRVLNFIWSLVTDNVGGHNSDPTIAIAPNIQFKREIVDEFFYTVLYAIIVYMLATASFKLIDKIPDHILRWMGQGVSSFGDINQDPTESLTRYAALGGMTAGRNVAEAVHEAAGGIGGVAGQALAKLPNIHGKT